MLSLIRAISMFVGSWVAAQAVEAMLLSKPGAAVAQRLGFPEFGQPAGASRAASYVRGGVGLLLGALFAYQTREEVRPHPERPETMADRLGWVADVLIAASSLVRVGADLLREREQYGELHEATGTSPRE